MTPLREKLRLIGKVLRGELQDNLGLEPPVAVPGSEINAPESPQGSGVSDLVKDCADLLGELEGMKGRVDEKAAPLAEHVMINLQEIMERAGAVRIEDETQFDVSRHQPVPAKVAAPGTAIKATLDAGYEFGGRVVKRARVSLV